MTKPRIIGGAKPLPRSRATTTRWAQRTSSVRSYGSRVTGSPPPASSTNMSNRHDLIRSRWRADGSIRFYRDEPTLPGVSELQNCNSHGIAPTIVQSGGYSDNRAMNLTLTTATGRYPRIGGGRADNQCNARRLRRHHHGTLLGHVLLQHSHARPLSHDRNTTRI